MATYITRTLTTTNAKGFTCYFLVLVDGSGDDFLKRISADRFNSYKDQAFDSYTRIGETCKKGIKRIHHTFMIDVKSAK